MSTGTNKRIPHMKQLPRFLISSVQVSFKNWEEAVFLQPNTHIWMMGTCTIPFSISAIVIWRIPGWREAMNSKFVMKLVRGCGTTNTHTTDAIFRRSTASMNNMLGRFPLRRQGVSTIQKEAFQSLLHWMCVCSATDITLRYLQTFNSRKKRVTFRHLGWASWWWIRSNQISG